MLNLEIQATKPKPLYTVIGRPPFSYFRIDIYNPRCMAIVFDSVQRAIRVFRGVYSVNTWWVYLVTEQESKFLECVL